MGLHRAERKKPPRHATPTQSACEGGALYSHWLIAHKQRRRLRLRNSPNSFPEKHCAWVYLRDVDGVFGSEELRALPEAVERGNDGTRKEVLQNLKE